MTFEEFLNMNIPASIKYSITKSGNKACITLFYAGFTVMLNFFEDNGAVAIKHKGADILNLTSIKDFQWLLGVASSVGTAVWQEYYYSGRGLPV